ncbi:hypothetical protein EJB05_34388 [Eragrostis curvula]|uniref:Uncharacterized protein n=1 Tax=Eragrostis curvula TaxID=38414 RepID=A0A5J9U4V6_9POAL|nr:hypothetical protein EJB05_34388 [Eragrostis curvula]
MWDQAAVAALLPGLPACLDVGFRPPVAAGGGGCDDVHPKRVVALGQLDAFMISASASCLP